MLGSHGFQGGQLDFYWYNLDSYNYGRGSQVKARQESVFQWILAKEQEMQTSAKVLSWQGPTRTASAGYVRAARRWRTQPTPANRPVAHT